MGLHGERREKRIPPDTLMLPVKQHCILHEELQSEQIVKLDVELWHEADVLIIPCVFYGTEKASPQVPSVHVSSFRQPQHSFCELVRCRVGKENDNKCTVPLVPLEAHNCSKCPCIFRFTCRVTSGSCPLQEKHPYSNVTSSCFTVDEKKSIRREFFKLRSFHWTSKWYGTIHPST